MSSTPERDALIEELVRQYRNQLDAQLPEGNRTLDQIEEIAGHLGENVSQEVQKRLVNKQTKRPRSKRQDCTCGQKARYKGRQPRTLVTRHGCLTLYRACYYCRHCHQTLVPADALLGLDAGCTTRQVRLFAGWLCALLPFAQAATTLAMLTKVTLSAATLERISVALGTSLRAAQQQQAHDHRNARLPEPDGKRLRRLYIGMDGLFVPLRDAWKKDQSQGELACRFGECKLGVVYQTAQDKQGRDARVAVSDYVATLASVETFEPLLATLAHQHGHHHAQEIVVLGDGAAWIGQVAARQFPGAVQIVDFYHACDHLAAYAEARFGKDSPAGKLWQKARQDELKTGQVPRVLREIAAWRPANEAKRKLRKTTYRYFVNNASRMRYQTFLEKGYHIGSGVVEAGCKHIVGQRLDQAGMHWRQETAEAIATLRAAQLSTHPPDLRAHCAMSH